MLNGAVKGEEEKTSLDGSGSPPYNCLKITADCNYSCCGGEEAERGWVEERAVRGPGYPSWLPGLPQLDGKWPLTPTSEYPIPFFGPCWGTVTAQTLSLQLPDPAERPSPLPLPLAHPGTCIKTTGLVRGDLSSSPQLAEDVWQVGFPLVPVPKVPRNGDYCIANNAWGCTN